MSFLFLAKSYTTSSSDCKSELCLYLFLNTDSAKVMLTYIVHIGASPARCVTTALLQQRKFSTDLWKGALRFTARCYNNFPVLHSAK